MLRVLNRVLAFVFIDIALILTLDAIRLIPSMSAAILALTGIGLSAFAGICWQLAEENEG